MADIWIAYETRNLILSRVYADQGRAFRKALGEIVPTLDDAFRSEEEDEFRTHMGVSTSGRECARELWYKWRWASSRYFEGRMCLLFNRGHLEEGRFGALLKVAGFQVWQTDEEGKQFRVSHFGGHYGSAIDGVLQGIPEMPNEPVLAEMKTHNDKSFKKLAGDWNADKQEFEGGEGVKKSKPEHWVQMQQYMEYYNLRYALYCAVNKNDDQLYFEIVQFEPEAAAYWRERAERIIFMKSTPPRLSENAGFWKCKYCDERQVCHYNGEVKVNCRTCEAAEPLPNGTWHCRTKNLTLDKAAQLAGCDDWQKHHCL